MVFIITIEFVNYFITFLSRIDYSHGYIRENIGVEGWQTIFRRYGSYVNMPMFFKQYYYFLLPEIVKRYLADKK